MLTNTKLEWNRKPAFAVGDAIIEEPTGWRYITDNLVKPANALHKDGKGFELGGGSRRLRAGLQQQVTLKKGQRYLAKGVFTPEIYLGPDQRFEAGSVNVYFNLNGVKGGVSPANPLTNHQRATTLFVFEVREDGDVLLSMWLESTWELMEVKATFHEIVIEEVPQTYGTPTLISVLPGSTPTPDPEPETPPVPEPETPPAPTSPQALIEQLRAQEVIFRAKAAACIAAAEYVAREIAKLSEGA